MAATSSRIRAHDVDWGQPSPDWPDGPLDARMAKLIGVLKDAGDQILSLISSSSSNTASACSGVQVAGISTGIGRRCAGKGDGGDPLMAWLRAAAAHAARRGHERP